MSWIRAASWSHAPGLQLQADILRDLAGGLGAVCQEQVVPGLGQVVHAGGPMLRPDPDPSPPECRCLPVGCNQSEASALLSAYRTITGGRPPMSGVSAKARRSSSSEVIRAGHVQQGETPVMTEALEDSFQDRATS